MKLYRITGGPLKFAAGQMLSLDEKQFAARKSLFDADSVEKKGKRMLAIATGAQEFKVGEVIGLDELPKGLTAHVEEVDKKSDDAKSDKPAGEQAALV